jgi:hypothetical protein
MELAQIIKTLLERKLALVPVFLIALFLAIYSGYKISGSGLQPRSMAYGAATQQVLIDSPKSALVDLNKDTTPLSVRASVYAEFMRSSAIVQGIANRLHIPAYWITTQGPFASIGSDQNVTQPAVSRANQVRAENQNYRLAFDVQENLPVITIYAQAPDGAKAIALSAAAVQSLNGYVTHLQKTQQITDAVVVRALGPPDGGLVTKGARKSVMALVFLLVAGLGCAIIVGVASVRRSWKQLERTDDSADGHADVDPLAGFDTTFSGNGRTAVGAESLRR